VSGHVYVGSCEYMYVCMWGHVCMWSSVYMYVCIWGHVCMCVCGVKSVFKVSVVL
jgi:hypothetical protein